jgi:hypothetical protein
MYACDFAARTFVELKDLRHERSTGKVKIRSKQRR